MRTLFVLPATSNRTWHYALPETAGLFEWMHESGFEELADVGRYAGFANVEILDKGFLPSGKAMAFPKPESFYIQVNSPIHTSSVEQAWFR